MSLTIPERIARYKAETKRIIDSWGVAESMNELEDLCRGKTVSVCISGNCDAGSAELVGGNFLCLKECASVKFKVAGFDAPFGFFNASADCDMVLVVEVRSLAESTGIFIEEAPELRPCLNFFSDDGKPVLTDADYPVYRFVVQSTVASVSNVVWRLNLFFDLESR